MSLLFGIPLLVLMGKKQVKAKEALILCCLFLAGAMLIFIAA